MKNNENMYMSIHIHTCIYIYIYVYIYIIIYIYIHDINPHVQTAWWPGLFYIPRPAYPPHSRVNAKKLCRHPAGWR